MSPKFIVIIGATGNQGSSVANVFLQESGWMVRSLNRDSSSTKAQALADRGTEVVEANIDTRNTLSSALEGASAIFAISDLRGLYGDPDNQEKPKLGQSLNAWAGEHETQQLQNVIDEAAIVTTLERFVLLFISKASKWSKDKYTHVYHFDSKAKAKEYGKRNYPDLWANTSIYQAGLFLSNFRSGGMSPPVKVSNSKH